MPSARVAGSAAGSVAEVLTTSRSPGAQVVGQPAEGVVDERAVVAARDQHPHLVAREPARLGRRARLVGGREREGERLADGGGDAHAAGSISAPAA